MSSRGSDNSTLLRPPCRAPPRLEPLPVCLCLGLYIGYNQLPVNDAGKPEYKDSCSLFDVPMSNHNGRRDNVSFALRHAFLAEFQKVDPQSSMLGVSQMATVTQDGTDVKPKKAKFPYALVFDPEPTLTLVPCNFNDVTGQLRSLAEYGWVNRSIFSVYAVHDPWISRPAGQPDLRLVGKLVLDSPFVTSAFGDTRLFFKHTFQTEEQDLLRSTTGGAARVAAWEKYNAAHYKEEGTAWYAQHLPRQ